MANKKYKLANNDYWESSGVYDLTEGKTQREVNAALKGSLNTAEGDIATLQTAITAESIAVVLTPNTENIARSQGIVVYSPITKIAFVYARGDNYHDGSDHAIPTGVLFTLPNNIRPVGNTIVVASMAMMDGKPATYQFELNSSGQIINNYSQNIKSFMLVGCFKYI